MNFFGRKPKIKGELGYFGLGEWWLAAFSKEERDYIEDVYHPLGGQKGSLTQGDITFMSISVATLFSGLSTWFRKTPKDREIARRLLAKAVEVTDPQTDVIGLHFVYHALIEVWYRDRNNLANALDEAIQACEKQIEIAPQAAETFKKQYPNSPLPRHHGYSQLMTIYDKQGRYDDAIRIAHQAKSLGWIDRVDEIVTRYEKKKAKQKR